MRDGPGTPGQIVPDVRGKPGLAEERGNRIGLRRADFNRDHAAALQQARQIGDNAAVAIETIGAGKEGG